MDPDDWILTDLVYKHSDVSRRPLHTGGGNGMKGFAEITSIALIISLALSIQTPASRPSNPSDYWIKTALDSVMVRNGHFDSDRIQVSTRDGVVKLSGNVLTGDEKGLVQLLAIQIPGVKALKSNIQVMPAVNQNVELEKESQSALFGNPLVYIRELKVQAQNGIVTLKGIVYQTEQKRLADGLVSMLPGVNTVINNIAVLHRKY